ncbi:MAG TPA: type II toxin-antitoxin system RelE/ParE family toxin [Flavipsychrobacter sp.]
MEERIVWSMLAFDDLQAIYEYIANDSAFYAARLVEGIEKRISTLPLQPYIGRAVPEKGADGIREVMYGNYRIMYSIHKLPTIYIYRIIRTSQNYR